MGTDISVIIPAFDEGNAINGTIERIHYINRARAGEGGVEIIAVDGNPALNTLKAIKDSDVVKAASRKGRARQMNAGAARAGGDALVFLHADTLLPEGAFDEIARTLERGDYVGGAFGLEIGSARKVYRVIEFGVSLRLKLLGLPYGDQAFFFRRDFFEAAGGFSDIPIMEDVELIERVKGLGGKVALLSRKVVTSPRRWEAEGVVRCTLRNWALVSLYFLGVDPARLGVFYRAN